MPGNELSEWPAQRKPYVIQSTPSGIMDKAGKYVKTGKDFSSQIIILKQELRNVVHLL